MVLVANFPFAVVIELHRGTMGSPESHAYEMGGPLLAQHWLEAPGQPEYPGLGNLDQDGAYAQDGRVQEVGWLCQTASDHQLAQKAVYCQETAVGEVPAVLNRSETHCH